LYLHLGQNTIVKQKDIIGIFDIEKASTEKRTREFLAKAEKNGQVVNVSYEMPKTFCVCVHPQTGVRVYITPISVQTLQRRQNNILG